ncbi:MAG: hypothetical protein WKG01_28390 [Kofleriaceae bacterium]
MTAPVELVRELLYYRDMRLLNQRDWGLIAAFLAGSSLAVPILAPFALGSLVGLVMQKIRALRQRQAIAGIVLPPIVTMPGSTTLYGVARRFRGTVESLLDSSPVLLEHAVVRDRKGGVLLRRTESRPFLLDVEGRAPVLVTGVTRVTSSAAVLARRVKVKRGDPRLAKMGVPDDLAVTGDLEVAHVIADGPGLAVTGLIEDEAVAEMAFHRDGGQTPVMRGRIGSPILVEDCRLIGAALT